MRQLTKFFALSKASPNGSDQNMMMLTRCRLKSNTWSPLVTPAVNRKARRKISIQIAPRILCRIELACKKLTLCSKFDALALLRSRWWGWAYAPTWCMQYMRIGTHQLFSSATTYWSPHPFVHWSAMGARIDQLYSSSQYHCQPTGPIILLWCCW